MLCSACTGGYTVFRGISARETSMTKPLATLATTTWQLPPSLDFPARSAVGDGGPNRLASGDGGGTAATPAARARKRPREPELSQPASGAQLRYRHSEIPVATGNRPWLATEATKC